MGSFLAEMAARTRFPVRLNLAEADAIVAAAGGGRGSRELNSAVRRIHRAANRKRERAMKAARR